MNFETGVKDDCFASILMELTMQYAKLTDAHTFLLIETDNSRRFAGKEHLKDLYRRGELKPCGKDSEITVDTTLSQMIEVQNVDDQNGGEEEKKEDKDKEASVLDGRARRHIGELPSERRQRMRNEKKTYNKLVNMSYKTDESFGTFLMEALMKYSCVNDTNIFFLIETNHGRRFTGKKHLCEQYLEGDLRPTGDDVEMGLDQTIRVANERRIFKPKEDKGEDESRDETPSEGSERKRKESETSMDSSDQPVKRRQPHVGLLPSERREKARQEREAKEAALNPPPPPPPQTADAGGDAGRKHKGELPSERRERLLREREAAEMQSGPGYICGPSNFPSGYGDAAAMAGYAERYGWAGGSTGYDASFASGYADNGYGYKSSYGNWKSGGTIQGEEKISKSHSQYGW